MRILDAICLNIPVHDGINGKSGYRFDPQFLGNVLPVTDDRSKADTQFVGYFLIYKSPGKEFQDFDFSGGKVVCIHDF